VEPVERHGAAPAMTMEVQLYEPSHREQRFGCHVTLHVPSRHAINIREEAKDLYESIDLAERRLVRDLTDFRERRITEARHPKKYHAARLVEEYGTPPPIVPVEEPSTTDEAARRGR
jgi:ribosome-associated translation inhibitor RaiA